MPEEFTRKVSIVKTYCPRCFAQYEGPLTECPEDGTPLRGAGNDPLIGKVFADRYEIQSVLGLGGMSIVYKARHRLMERTVAIKMLHNTFKEDITSLERFKLEAQAASSLNHTNIITVYDFGVTPEGELFFVMDCLEGENLKELIERKGRVPYQRALPIFRQVCDGLDAAHKKGIVHRDLKSANVVLLKEDNNEIVKIVDFGIAKMLPGSGKEHQQLTQTGEVFGSPIYMSPEQCIGKTLDARSDIYALGCLMYETLTGDPPLLGDNVLETMNKHVNDLPKPIYEAYPDVNCPTDLDELILKCMAKNPDHRYQSAAEVRDILGAMLVASQARSGTVGGAISGTTQPVPAARAGTTGSSLTGQQVIVHRALPTVTIVLGVVTTLLLGVVAFISLWPGPENDRGTPLDKLIWLVTMGSAESAVSKNDFASAESAYLNAENRARTFGDGKARLVAVLKGKRDLYDKWEGHAEQLETTNKEIVAIEKERLKKELAYQLQLLSSLGEKSSSSVKKANATLRGEAQVSSLLATASKLSAANLYIEEQQFLERAIAVEKKILDPDSIAFAQLAAKLAEPLEEQHKFDQVRPLLVESVRIYKIHQADNQAEYIKALNALGQFDLDQGNIGPAKQELNDALAKARSLKNNQEVLVLCLRSYENLLRQTQCGAEADKISAEAAAIEKTLKD